MSMLVDAFGMKALALEATENEVFSALSTIIVATWHDADDELFGMIFDGLRRSVLSCRAERSRREAVRAGRKMS
jgi:hypothetical protein